MSGVSRFFSLLVKPAVSTPRQSSYRVDLLPQAVPDLIWNEYRVRGKDMPKEHEACLEKLRATLGTVRKHTTAEEREAAHLEEDQKRSLVVFRGPDGGRVALFHRKCCRASNLNHGWRAWLRQNDIRPPLSLTPTSTSCRGRFQAGRSSSTRGPRHDAERARRDCAKIAVLEFIETNEEDPIVRRKLESVIQELIDAIELWEF